MPGQVEGKIASISEAGNLITDIAAEKLADAPRDDRVTIKCDEHETIGIYEVGHEQPDFTLVAVMGESGCLELEIVGDSAKIMLGVGVGESVEVCW